MADYLIPEATATLVLDEPPFAGAEIEARLSLSPDVYFGTRQWLAQASAKDSGTDDLMEAARVLAGIFAEHGLAGWNLTRKSGPIPATVEGLTSLDVRLLFKIVGTWVGHIGSVPIPLSEASPAGPEPVRARKRTPSPNGRSRSASSPPPRSQNPDSSGSSTAIAPV